jgi:hypothetical protein
MAFARADMAMVADGGIEATRFEILIIINLVRVRPVRSRPQAGRTS